MLSTLIEGPNAGSDSLLVSTPIPWTAVSHDGWIHTTSQGTGNGLAVFSFDPNIGATRTGTLTIAGQQLSLVQAASGSVRANPIPLVTSGLSSPGGLAVDGQGNVYIADSGHNAIKEWNASTQQISTLVSTGLSHPSGLAVGGQGNVYIADTGHNAIKEWNASTQQISTLVSTGLSNPSGLAVDGQGNVYIADTGHNAIKEWNALTQQTSTLVASGLSAPQGLAVDAQGTLYIADTGDNAIKQYSVGSQTLSNVVASGLKGPRGVSVDGQGNVYIADTGHGIIQEYSPSANLVYTLISTGLTAPAGMVVDSQGNLNIVDESSSLLKQMPRAFVAVGPLLIDGSAGSSSTPQVLAINPTLTGVFAPSSDQAWLTVGGATSGSIGFSYDANLSGAARTANLNVLGQTMVIRQLVNVIPSLSSSAPTASCYSPVVFTATLSPAATGTVRFYDGDQALGSAPVNMAGGSASYTTTDLVPGTHGITAVYSGDSTYAPGRSNVFSQYINHVATSTIIYTTPFAAPYGTPISITAMEPFYAASGTITFMDGSKTLAVVTVAGGVASYTTYDTQLSVGSHVITAVYSGDTIYAPSTSDGRPQTVFPPPSVLSNSATVLRSSASTTQFSKPLTLTATVTSGVTGTVSFYDGKRLLGTVSLNGNSASLSTTRLNKGKHVIHATYNGDVAFLSSNSKALTVVVRSKR